MADLPSLRNIGDLLITSLASVPVSVTAGGTGDNTAVTGTTIDRLDPATGALAGSVKLSLLWTTTLAAAATLSLKTISISHSPDGSTWTTGFATFADPGVVATGPAGGGTVTGVTSVGYDLTGAYRFIRLLWMPDLSAANTDTATIWGAAIKAGFDRLPV